MLISVRHSTRYLYDEPTAYSIQSLRLTPRTFRGQRVIRWRIEAPNIERAASYVDGFGNTCHVTTLAQPHEEVTVLARGEVETEDMAGVVGGFAESAPPRIYLRATEFTRADEAITELAHGIEGATVLERLHALMACVHQAVVYEVGTTHPATTAAAALAAGRGVCQDHAHVLIAAAHVLGIPARYVTGYLLHNEAAQAEAHHAWAEAHVDGLGWIGFDAANGVCPTEQYIRLACGLDARDAAPVRGTRRGGAQERLDVEVEVQQQATQQ